MARKYIIDNTKNMTLKQCLRIRDNQYRNVDCTEDYCPFAIEQRIAELGTKQAERMVDHRHVGEFDEQLFALLPAGQQLLNLIDKAYLNFNKGVKMNYTQAMHHIKTLCDCFGYHKSNNDMDLEIPWRAKKMEDGTVLTLWFKKQSIYFTRDNQTVRHFKNARSLHLPDIKWIAQKSYISPAKTMDYIESFTK